MSRDYSRVRYWIDLFGRLWKGPFSPDDTLHYCTFHGYMIVAPFDAIWILERSDEPEDAEEITHEQAERAMRLYSPR